MIIEVNGYLSWAACVVDCCVVIAGGNVFSGETSDLRRLCAQVGLIDAYECIRTCV